MRVGDKGTQTFITTHTATLVNHGDFNLHLFAVLSHIGLGTSLGKPEEGKAKFV